MGNINCRNHDRDRRRIPSGRLYRAILSLALCARLLSVRLSRFPPPTPGLPRDNGRATGRYNRLPGSRGSGSTFGVELFCTHYAGGCSDDSIRLNGNRPNGKYERIGVVWIIPLSWQTHRFRDMSRYRYQCDVQSESVFPCDRPLRVSPLPGKSIPQLTPLCRYTRYSCTLRLF